MQRDYQICTRCIMDTSDPDIVFDEHGVCNHCHDHEKLKKRHLFPEEERGRRLSDLLRRVKKSGRGKDYDCIIGLSGGVDSSYLAYQTKVHGLRPLAVHLDNGWDSEIAVANIEKVVKHLGIDLHTHVINWEEFKDLQLAFFKASVIDIELLTDHAIFAAIYHVARKHGIRYFLSGYNVATEAVMPRRWFYANKLDSLNIKAIYRAFGSGRKLQTFPLLTLADIIMFVYLRRLVMIPLLNYIPAYNKHEAMHVLHKELGWVDYGGKHYESKFTHIYQAYILPAKFHVDKRRAYLSSLIHSNHLTRDQALEIVNKPAYDEKQLSEDVEYLRKKLNMSEEEFRAYLKAPERSHLEFRSFEAVYRTLKPFMDLLGISHWRNVDDSDE